MNLKHKWPLAVAALIMLLLTWLDGDFSAFRQLSAADILPVLAVAAVAFLLKTGALSALLFGVKKLWERLSKPKDKNNET